MTTLPIKYPTDSFAGRPGSRSVALLILLIAAALVLFYALRLPAVAQEEMTQAQLFDLIKTGHVVSLTNQPDAATGIRYLAGTYQKSPGALAGFKVPVDLQLDPYLLSEIRQAGYKGTITTINNTNVALPLFLNFLPILLIFCVVGWMISRLSSRR